MAIAQEVAQAPRRGEQKSIQGALNQFVSFVFFTFYSYVLMLCAIHMCFIMCKKLCANELIMNQIDYEPN